MGKWQQAPEEARECCAWLMWRYGPDRHCDGADIIADRLWALFDGNQIERDYIEHGFNRKAISQAPPPHADAPTQEPHNTESSE